MKQRLLAFVRRPLGALVISIAVCLALYLLLDWLFPGVRR